MPTKIDEVKEEPPKVSGLPIKANTEETKPTKREKTRILVGKEESDEDSRNGWIEYQKKGTKNPKRYACRRRWVRKDGVWVKSKAKRLSSILPLTEEEYVARLEWEGRDKDTGRRKSG